MFEIATSDLQLLENIINNIFDIAEGKRSTYEKVLCKDKKIEKLNDIVIHRLASMISTKKKDIHPIEEVTLSHNNESKLDKIGEIQNTYEDNQHSRLINNKHNAINEPYKEEKVESVPTNMLKNDFTSETDDDTYLMILKLSHNKYKIKSLLQNSAISDKLFLKLLKMYSWSNENFFENNDNRDVSAAIILRFYADIERHSHVKYSVQGFVRIIVQCKEPLLLDAIAYLEPLQKSFKSDAKDQNYSIITAIATHSLTSPSVLNMLVKKASSYVKTLIAMRTDCDDSMQKILYEDGDDIVTEALSHNENLDKKVVKLLLKNDLYAKNIAKHIRLNDEIFDMLIKKYSSQLARNYSISFDMQKKLFEINNEYTKIALASNKYIDNYSMVNLLFNGSQDINFDIFINRDITTKTDK
ncbi:MAG: hypothetical protein WC665_02325 [Sulfurimonas sp.]